MDYMGRAALHVVANDRKGDVELTRFLLNQHVNIDLPDSKGRSPLYIAIESDNFDVAEELCKQGGTIIANKERIAKMLCQAGFDNDLRKIDLLHRADINLEISDYDKRNVGHLAAAEGHMQILQFLAEKTNFNFMATDRWGNTVFSEMKDPEQK